MTSLAHKQAANVDGIKPLVELCKTGRLFDVQDWIRAGRPVDPPPARKANGPWSPLEFAIERGFHSLVQVLLEADATFEKSGNGGEMSRALRLRRFDIAKLLVKHGYDAASVDMNEVFETWDGDIMDYFIDLGADVEKGDPLARALCHRIRTALRVLKRCRGHFPSFQRQADIALRYHCKEGNLKWVSLMLWAGADPYSEGPEYPSDETHEDEHGISALAFAALYRRFDVFKLKQLRVDLTQPSMRTVAMYCCSNEGLSLLNELLDRGMKVNYQENGGCSLIQHAIGHMSWNLRFSEGRSKGKLDTQEAKEQISVIEVLVRRGAKWVPKDNNEINAARRSLLKLVPRFSLAFFSIMVENKACSRADIQALVGGTMKKHLGSHSSLIERFMSSLPEAVEQTPA